MILRFKASPCTAIAMFGDFSDDDLIRREMEATLACRFVFLHANLSSTTKSIRIFFPHPCPFSERKPVSMFMCILKHSPAGQIVSISSKAFFLTSLNSPN